MQATCAILYELSEGQDADGLHYGIMPYLLSHPALGIVSSMVGAGDNLGLVYYVNRIFRGRHLGRLLYVCSCFQLYALVGAAHHSLLRQYFRLASMPFFAKENAKGIPYSQTAVLTAFCLPTRLSKSNCVRISPTSNPGHASKVMLAYVF